MDIRKFKVHKDKRGSLIAWENQQNIPFDIKRVFCIYGMPGFERGCHAHKTEEEVLICLQGSCTIVLNDGKEEKRFCLKSPDEGLLIEKNTWLKMRDFSQGTILLVLSDSLYNEADYIRSYEEFVERVQGK